MSNLIQEQSSNCLHVILTRFNLPTGGKELKIRQSPSWLAERFDLFETVCLPSVKSQSEQDFIWFIFFDVDTPEKFRNRAKQYQKDYQNIKLFWVKKAPLKFIRLQIYAHIKTTTSVLITTRLDNDDALNSIFIENVRQEQKNIRLDQSKVINFDNGIVFQSGRAYLHRDTSNAFASLIEPFVGNVDTMKTVWCTQHTRLSKLADVKHVAGSAMWMQVVHGSNVSNRIRGYRINNSVVDENFDTLLQYIRTDSIYRIFFENIFFSPLRSIREWAFRRLKDVYYLLKN